MHLLNCTVALTTQLQRTEGTAQLAAAWLADRKVGLQAMAKSALGWGLSVEQSVPALSTAPGHLSALRSGSLVLP